MDMSDRAWFLERAEAELDLANAAHHERAAHTHFRRAAIYLDHADRGPANEN